MLRAPNSSPGSHPHWDHPPALQAAGKQIMGALTQPTAVDRPTLSQWVRVAKNKKKQLLFYMLCSASVSLSVYFCIVFKILRPKIIYWKHFDFWLDKSNPTVRCTHLVFYEACSTS